MNNYQKRFVLFVAIIVVFAAAVHLTFRPSDCGNFDCFQEKMTTCSRTSFVNNLIEASWKYEILGPGSESNTCDIKVSLLSSKEGKIDLRDLEGQSMTCTYEYGVVSYPERNLDRCSGELKEGLQTSIIKRLHSYILDNVGEIDDALLGF